MKVVRPLHFHTLHQPHLQIHPRTLITPPHLQTCPVQGTVAMPLRGYFRQDLRPKQNAVMKAESVLIVGQHQRLFGGGMVTGIIYAMLVDFITK